MTKSNPQPGRGARARGGAIALLAGALAGCAAPATTSAVAPPSGSDPYVLVLGTAQDGGLPHIGCETGNCAAARIDPARRRLVTSLMLCDPRSGKRWLFDCTPDIGEQLHRAQGNPSSRPAGAPGGPRPPPFEGMFLTHAHMGHYGGLLELGREALDVKAIPAYVTPRFANFLRNSDPWRKMVNDGALVLHEITPGEPVELAPDLQVDCVRVPHRDEFSDTVAFEIRGPHHRLLYLPDIDKWEKWDTWSAPLSPFAPDAVPQRIEERIAAVDYALLDGCFDADGEIHGRSMKDIPHPFIAESVARFAALPADQRARVFFTHLNHTNPAADPAGAAAKAVRAAGMHVLEDGRVFGL